MKVTVKNRTKDVSLTQQEYDDFLKNGKVPSRLSTEDYLFMTTGYLREDEKLSTTEMIAKHTKPREQSGESEFNQSTASELCEAFDYPQALVTPKQLAKITQEELDQLDAEDDTDQDRRYHR